MRQSDYKSWGYINYFKDRSCCRISAQAPAGRIICEQCRPTFSEIVKEWKKKQDETRQKNESIKTVFEQQSFDFKQQLVNFQDQWSQEYQALLQENGRLNKVLEQQENEKRALKKKVGEQAKSLQAFEESLKIKTEEAKSLEEELEKRGYGDSNFIENSLALAGEIDITPQEEGEFDPISTKDIEQFFSEGVGEEDFEKEEI